MATDIEESDTDEHEYPGPSKRQRIIGDSQDLKSSDENNEAPQELESSTEVANNEEDRIAKEKLQYWQACQVVKGFLDNTINHVLENYYTTSAESYTFVNPWYNLLFLGTQMEDTAITTAIRTIGLSGVMNLTQSFSLFDRIFDTSINSENTQILAPTMTSLSSNSETVDTSAEGNGLSDSDHQQDFLDRAVAEAIKKKGLSTLSVDYG